jgi:hypothetical protein
MLEADRFRPLGKYRTPKVRGGAFVPRLIRGEAEVVGLTDGAIPWPKYKTDHRPGIIVCAGLARGGRGKDVPQLDASERARWRKQALDWLRADLAFWADALDKSPDGRSPAQGALRGWRSERALAGVREPEELAKLPESERADCTRFWAAVEGLLVRCLASPPGK